jgi:hypothetical protein
MALANVVFQDSRRNFVFCYTDEYLPTNSTVAINGVNAKQYFTYTSTQGWNPSASAFSQGVIGFEYNPNSFILGDTFVITNSAGTSTISSYGPLPSNNLNLYYDASLNSSYSGTGTTWYDISTGGSYTGTLTNDPVYSSSNGGFFTFDGTNDYVEVAGSTGLNYANTTFTVSVWAKGTALQKGYLIAKGLTATAGGGGWGLYVDTDGFAYFEGKNSTAGATAFVRPSSTYVSDGAWHNIVAVVTTSTTVVGSNTASIYIDGVLSNGNITQSLVYSSEAAKTVNLARRNGGSGSNYYSGSIANVQVWDTGLTAAQILQNYNAFNTRFISGSSIVTNGLSLNLDAGNAWSLSQNSTTWTDTSGNSRNGTLTNGPIYSFVNGGCVSFDGTNDYVSGSLSTLTDWTICLWYSSNDITSANVFYPFGGTSGATGLGFGGSLDSSVQNKWYYFDGTNIINSGSTTVTTNTWYYLVVTKTSTTYKLYTNGVLTTTSTGVNNSLTQYNLGRRGDGSWYVNGKIGMVTVYNRELRAVEIEKNYNNTRSRFNSTVTIPTAGLTQYVDANNRQSYFGTGSTWSDISGAGTNNTLVGSPTYSPRLNNTSDGYFYTNGTSSYINMGSTSSNGTAITISAWMYFDNTGFGTRSILGKSNFTLSTFPGWFTFYYSSNTGPFQYRPYFQYMISASSIDSFFCSTLTFNTWINYTITKNPTTPTSTTWTVYRNGTSDGAASVGFNDSLTNTLLIGYLQNNYGSSRTSQILIYNTAMPGSSVLALYNSTKSRYGL